MSHLLIAAILLLATFAAAQNIGTISLREGVDGYEGTTDATLYEGFTTGDDWEDNSNGGGSEFFTGVILQNSYRRRALIRFDLSGLQPETEVLGARLLLYANREKSGNEPYTIHRVLSPWGEGNVVAISLPGQGTEAETGDATWTHNFFNQTEWTTHGGDFVTSPSAMADVIGSAEFTSSEMVADIENWIENPGQNFGWIVLGNESGFANAKSFHSSEGPESLRPLLEIFTPASETFAVILNDKDTSATLDANADSIIDAADVYLHLF